MDPPPAWETPSGRKMERERERESAAPYARKIGWVGRARAPCRAHARACSSRQALNPFRGFLGQTKPRAKYLGVIVVVMIVMVVVVVVVVVGCDHCSSAQREQEEGWAENPGLAQHGFEVMMLFSRLKNLHERHKTFYPLPPHSKFPPFSQKSISIR
jgi:hypothetical protein